MTHEELSDYLARSDSNSLGMSHICLVTNELAEFHQNGGLGTANSGLLSAFVASKMKVTVLYTAQLDKNKPQIADGILLLQNKGITFFLIQDMIPQGWINSPRRVSYACFWFLRTYDADAIHFNDYLGNGFYSCQAKRTGSALLNSALFITVHGPTRWACQIDQRPISNIDLEEICFLEHRSIEMSDVVLGVSHHLLTWLTDCGVQLPLNSYVHKNILPYNSFRKRDGSIRPQQLAEVVFFARQDVRKGFLTFIEMVKQVAHLLPHLKFTFLGKFSRIAGEHSGAVALDALRNVSNAVEFRTNYDRDKAMAYLRRPGVLAVIPSVDENSPCTVFECIEAGIPFIAANVGGIPELVADKNASMTLFEPTAKALTECVLSVYDRGLAVAELAFDNLEMASTLMRGFQVLAGEINSQTVDIIDSADIQNPLVSIVITHFNRHHYLEGLLAAISEQRYQNFEVIVVDDGSTVPEAINYIRCLSERQFTFELKVVRIPNSYLGAARNAGVALANGVFVKFQDDDNLPFIDELRLMVRAATLNKAHIITAMSRFFETESNLEQPVTLGDFKYFPLGASLPLSLFRNEYGDANALVNREAFITSGGFTEIYGVGFEDYEYFVKAESSGFRVMFVPEPLFSYRVARGSMLQSTSTYRGAKRVRAGIKLSESKWLAQLVDFAHETELDREMKSQSWWRAGGRLNGDIHQQMLADDPNGSQNLERFLDLASKYDRLEETIHMVMHGHSVMFAQRWLEQSNKRLEQGFSRQILKGRPQAVRFVNEMLIELIEPTSNLPIGWSLVAVEETGLMIHPSELGATTRVRISGVIPTGANFVSVPFSHRNVKGSPARMSVAVERHGRILACSADVELDPGGEGEGQVYLERPLSYPADLVLSSVVEGKADFTWTFADRLYIGFSSQETVN